MHDIYDKDYRHKINIEKNTLVYDLIKNEEYYVDNIQVESFEVPNKNFIVGIKWHPELMDDEFVNKLFKEFVEKCK